MIKLTLIRDISDHQASQGRLYVDDEFFCFTLENPWQDNVPFISCIPVGTYTCGRTLSTRFGPTFEVMNVEGRSRILFHAGNRSKDTCGCILLGEKRGALEGDPAVLISRVAFQIFLEKLWDIDEFKLEVVEEE